MAALLSLEGIEKTYWLTSNQTLMALGKTDLEVQDREFIAIVGPSGCGKTTMLKLISGVLKPTKGRIMIEGIPLQNDHRQLLGMVFQQPALLPWRTVLDNVLLPCEVKGHDLRKARAMAKELLGLVGLEDFVNRHPRQLSYGMQQRVSICRALISDPRILLMDEPFAALDAITRFELTRLLLDVWSVKKNTVLFVTHNIQEAVFLADRVVVMTPRPGIIAEIIDVPLTRPRTEQHLYDKGFSSCIQAIHQLLGLNAL